jgi:serine/threonine-protein kinase RsbW
MVDAGRERLVIPADMVGVARAAAWAEEMVQRLVLPSSTAYGLQLCFEEALSNIVCHGFTGVCDAEQQEIVLELDRTPSALFVTIEDGGVPFDPRDVPSPAQGQTIEEVVVGGQGIHLMRQFSQGFDYEHRDGKNRLVLRFDITTEKG